MPFEVKLQRLLVKSGHQNEKVCLLPLRVKETLEQSANKTAAHVEVQRITTVFWRLADIV